MVGRGRWENKTHLEERQTRHTLVTSYTFLIYICCRSRSYLAVQNLVAIFSKHEFVARIHQSTQPCHVLDLPLILSTEPQHHSTQGHEQGPPTCPSRGWTFWKRSLQRCQAATWYPWKQNDVKGETVFNSSSTRVVDACSAVVSFSGSCTSYYSLTWGRITHVQSWEHDRAVDKFNKHLKGETKNERSDQKHYCKQYLTRDLPKAQRYCYKGFAF